MTSERPTDRALPHRAVATWLWLCTALLLGMIVVGGVTRLTGSGLSIVRWEPIVGALPPLNGSEWERVFALYKESPQFRLVNSHMDLDAFKSIFWWEYFHRLLGRRIGIVVALPLVFFTLKRWIERRRAIVLVGIFCLGGVQGLIGWLMVKSGLVDAPHVSHIRLTLHLVTGMLIFALVLWQAVDATWARSRARGLAEVSAEALTPVRRWAMLVTTLAAVTVTSGGLVAGLRSGHAFPTFPLIAGYWVPPGMFVADPLWLNFFDNVTLVQFQHRLLAYSVALAVLGTWLSARRRPLPNPARWAVRLLVAAVTLQITLGITTLLLHVPVWAAAAHQGNAALVLAACLNLVHALAIRVPHTSEAGERLRSREGPVSPSLSMGRNSASGSISHSGSGTSSIR